MEEDGTVAASYKYDAWGRVMSQGGFNSTLASLNPFRYRGYVYDEETGLYYLQSRYYDPQVGRFINADGYLTTGQGFTGNNCFAYCGNDPVNNKDSGGARYSYYADSVALPPKPPSNYIQDNSEHQNCYSYAFGLPVAANPGDYSAKKASDLMFYHKTIYTADEIKDFIFRDMATLNINVRSIETPNEKKDNEYVVAMKTSSKILDMTGVADYHFAVQLSDGTWADKPGNTPSRWNVIDGIDLKWDLGKIKGYYDTKTKYFAVERK